MDGDKYKNILEKKERRTQFLPTLRFALKMGSPCAIKMKKHKEIISYLIFGVLTTAVNIGTYFILNDCLNINYLISNMTAWILSVLFAYITNRRYVFNSSNDNRKDILKEISSFFGSRLMTGFLDVLFMYVTVNFNLLPNLIAKVVANIFVIIANYILSKFIVFKKIIKRRK